MVTEYTDLVVLFLAYHIVSIKCFELKNHAAIFCECHVSTKINLVTIFL